jgi:hypothetical protein
MEQLIEALDVGPSSAKDPTEPKSHLCTWTTVLRLGSRRVGGGRIAMGS